MASRCRFYENKEIDYETEMVVGWKTVIERRLIEEYENQNCFDDRLFDIALANDASVGEGGSLSRFKIVADYLYAVDSHNINIFNIEDLENPKDLEDVYAGFDIETIFNSGNHLF